MAMLTVAVPNVGGRKGVLTSFFLIAVTLSCRSILAAPTGIDSIADIDGAINDIDRRRLVPMADVISGKMNGFGHCQGHCENDDACNEGFVCVQRDFNDPIPGCRATANIIEGNSNYCLRPKDRETFEKMKPDETRLKIKWVRDDPNGHEREEKDKLGECEGDCDRDDDCRGNLVCQLRTANESFDGCTGGGSDVSEADYCVQPHLHSNNIFRRDGEPKDDEPDKPNDEVPDKPKDGEPEKPTDDAPEKPNDDVPEKPRSDNKSKPILGNVKPRVISTTSKYAPNGEFFLDKPRDVREGDVLMLIISRSNGSLLPQMSGWKTEASCFSRDDGQRECWTADTCRKRADSNNDYCSFFEDDKSIGKDPFTVVYTRLATTDDVNDAVGDFLQINLQERNSGWAILANLRQVYGLRGWKNNNNAEDEYSLFKDDLQLLSFAFADKKSASQYQYGSTVCAGGPFNSRSNDPARDAERRCFQLQGK